MENRYRLTRNNISGQYRFEVRKVGPRGESYWDVSLHTCPQNELDALQTLKTLNMVEKWEVIA